MGDHAQKRGTGNIVLFSQSSKQSHIESERSADGRQIVSLEAGFCFAGARFGHVVGGDLQNGGQIGFVGNRIIGFTTIYYL